MSRATIRVGAAQMLARFDLGENLARVLELMRAARDAGCDIIAFHESALTGYPEDAQIAAFNADDIADAEAQVQALAGELKLAVVLGSVAGDGKGGWLNGALIIDETGRAIGRYVKTWRAGEAWAWPGTGPVVFTVAGIDATVIICHDTRYPELVRLPVIAGARLLFIVNNENGVISEEKMLGFRSMQIARATENDIYAVMVNSAGDPDAIRGRHQSHGQSKVIDPLGNVLVEAGIFEQRLIVADLDLTKARGQHALRTVGKADWLHDRYGGGTEQPAYARWMNEGLALVQRWPAD